MSELTDEILTQYVDGVLPADQVAAVEEQLRQDPNAAARLEVFVRVKSGLRTVVVPEELLRPQATPQAVLNAKPEGFVAEAPPEALPELVVPKAGLSFVKAGVLASLLVLFFGYGAVLYQSTKQDVLGVVGGTGRAPSVIVTQETPVDLEIPGKATVRVEPNSRVEWEKSFSLNPFAKPDIQLSIQQGGIVARTEDAFWGSSLQVLTPSSIAFVKGTVFSVSVDSPQSSTLKVLAGSVLWHPMESVNGTMLPGVFVDAGFQGVYTMQGANRVPLVEHLQPESKASLFKTFQIGTRPKAALAVGTGPERVEQLFLPALLYLDDTKGVPLALRERLDRINGDIMREIMAHDQIPILQELEAKVPLLDPSQVVPFRMYLAACFAKWGDRQTAYNHLDAIQREFKEDPLSSLSLAGMILLSSRDADLPQNRSALEHALRTRFPNSPEVLWLEAFLLETAA